MNIKKLQRSTQNERANSRPLGKGAPDYASKGRGGVERFRASKTNPARARRLGV
jgi:hypothetical protein